jgi:hypothetical protein
LEENCEKEESVMLELYGWEVGMSTLAVLVLGLGAAVIGIVSFLIGEVKAWWEPVLVAVGAFIGGYVASEAFGTASTWGMEFEGLFLWPALIGAVVVGGVIDAITRFATGGTYISHPEPI